jgi:hypothetical protein
LGGSFIKYGLLGMIHVTCGPLEGVLVCLCRTFPGESFSMEEQGHLDLHRGLKPTGWMHLIEVKSYTIVLSYELKQGYVKYNVIMSWY